MTLVLPVTLSYLVLAQQFDPNELSMLPNVIDQIIWKGLGIFIALKILAWFMETLVLPEIKAWRQQERELAGRTRPRGAGAGTDGAVSAPVSQTPSPMHEQQKEKGSAAGGERPQATVPDKPGLSFSVQPAPAKEGRGRAEVGSAAGATRVQSRVSSGAPSIETIRRTLQNLGTQFDLPRLEGCEQLGGEGLELLGLVVDRALSGADTSGDECRQIAQSLCEWRQTLQKWMPGAWEEAGSAEEPRTIVGGFAADGGSSEGPTTVPGLKSKRLGCSLPTLRFVWPAPPSFLLMWAHQATISQWTEAGLSDETVDRLESMAEFCGQAWLRSYGGSPDQARNDRRRIWESWTSRLLEERSRDLRRRLQSGILTQAVVEAWARLWDKATAEIDPEVKVGAWSTDPASISGIKVATVEWEVPANGPTQSVWIVPPLPAGKPDAEQAILQTAELAVPRPCESPWREPVLSLLWAVDGANLAGVAERIQPVLQATAEIESKLRSLGNQAYPDELKMMVVNTYWLALCGIGSEVFDGELQSGRGAQWLNRVGKALPHVGLRIVHFDEGTRLWFRSDRETGGEAYRPALAQMGADETMYSKGNAPPPTGGPKLVKPKVVSNMDRKMQPTVSKPSEPAPSTPPSRSVPEAEVPAKPAIDEGVWLGPIHLIQSSGVLKDRRKLQDEVDKLRSVGKEILGLLGLSENQARADEVKRRIAEEYGAPLMRLINEIWSDITPNRAEAFKLLRRALAGTHLRLILPTDPEAAKYFEDSRDGRTRPAIVDADSDKVLLAGKRLPSRR